MKRSERDFIALFYGNWYKNFPIASGQEDLGRRSTWTVHIGSVVKQCADFMGYFTCFESRGRTDAVIQKASREAQAKIEWEWIQPFRPTVNEFKKLADAAKEENVELLVYIGYSNKIRHAQNIKTIKKAWQNIDKPLIAFLVTFSGKGSNRRFSTLQTHYLKAGTHRVVREQPALPWRVKNTVWHLLANTEAETEKHLLNHKYRERVHK